jgi:hypothetical protein
VNLSMGMHLTLALECTVCGVNNCVEPAADATSIALFGVAEVEDLYARGICPKCMRQHLPWTRRQQNALARWIMKRLGY